MLAPQFTQAQLFDVLDATWPPFSLSTIGEWIIREGRGGGSRVSAASWHGAIPETADFAQAEKAMRVLGQNPLFMLRPGHESLDEVLEKAGYTLFAPVRVLYAPVAALADGADLGRTVISCTPILALQKDMWQRGGIGPARIAVMNRVTEPKTALLARNGQDPVGTVFVALHKGIAMIHALEIRPEHRRTGQGMKITKAAAAWAQQQGAHSISLLVTRDNTAANALYESAGFREFASYHYRIKRIA